MMKLNQQPKGRVYEKIEAFLVFTESPTFGRDKVKFKGVVRSDSDEGANKQAKKLAGKRAFAELNCAINQEKYKAKGIQTI